ncbi:uncharacterized protein BT62DRAFT_555509 [Guyanagaster necrorhizus]|uniref:Uncharacterized protein n=1 Tax=Guyanagaster necrorhizus TaxID=856835 RepID=A0A9P7VI70_9AGAR|nr:uncharacterized protein BT62DRAFT_555509 [Guyanagaster necrorhizus MCA 3950]KAG7441038.1 hypothetical protein BT62DRAFT_555509 [Guyanagaster necrorhizus MCA 3950]
MLLAVSSMLYPPPGGLACFPPLRHGIVGRIRWKTREDPRAIREQVPTLQNLVHSSGDGQIPEITSANKTNSAWNEGVQSIISRSAIVSGNLGLHGGKEGDACLRYSRRTRAVGGYRAGRDTLGLGIRLEVPDPREVIETTRSRRRGEIQICIL